MDTKNIKNNNGLYEYLLLLGALLKKRGKDNLSEKVLLASKFISGSSSEFLHESRYTLIQVQQVNNGFLNKQEEQGLKNVIQQIDEAFKQVGGG